MANVHPDNTHLIPETVGTFEYSYKIANPRTVQMPVLATACRTLKSKKDTNTDEDTNILPNKALDIHKLLGIHFSMDGNTSKTGRLLTKKAKMKLANTELPPDGGPKQVTTVSNVFLSPTTSYSSLTANITPEDTNSLDVLLINKTKPHFGLAPSDSAIALMRPTK